MSTPATKTVNPICPSCFEETSTSEHLLLSTTLRCLEEGIITTDTKEKIILLNRMAKKLTGWSQEEAFGKNLSEVFNLLHSKSRKSAKHALEKLVSMEKAINLPKNTLLVSRDQAERFIGGNAAPIRDNDGQVIGVVLAFRDITESVQSEEALERQTRDLSKRVKELNCLYSISALLEKHGLTLKKIYKDIVNLIPLSLEQPERTSARLTIEGKIYTTEAFQASEWKHESLIAINDKPIGQLEVFLQQFNPELDALPFSVEESHLINAIAERLANITEVKQAEEALKKRVKLEGLVATISTQFINLQPEQMHVGIQFALKAMSLHMNADHTCLYEFLEHGQVLCVTQEWCAAGVESQKSQLQHVLVDPHTWWMKKLKQAETVHIPNVADLELETTPEKTCWQTHAIRSLIAVPLVRAGVLLGFIGFAALKTLKPWADEDVVFLETFASIISNALDRKHADEALQESEHRMDMAIKAANLGIWNGNCQTGDITFDPRGAEILGFPAVEMTQHHKNLSNLISTQDIQTLLQLWKQHLAGQTPYVSLEIRFQTPASRWKWVLHCGKVIECDEQGQPLRATGTLLDITDRKEAEEERANLERKLLQSQRIEALGRLSGGIAHDFNNILSPIICYTEMCLAGLPVANPSHSHLEQVLHSAKRAKELTRQLLACGRKQVLNVKGVHLDELVTTFRKMIRRTLREDIEIEICNDPHLYVAKADPSQIEQILLNLAVNAQDAMPNGGKLILSTQNVILDKEFSKTHDDIKPGPYVKLVVSDTGQGMSTETLSHIFEPFYTTKELGKGTGLGLPTVHGIVKQHSGCISVYSEEGLGTIFKIYLPTTEQPILAEAQSQATDVSLQGHETVLVVEDDEQVRTLVTQILTAYGYTVLGAADADEARRQVSQHPAPIPLLITDVIMPHINGKVLHNQLTLDHPTLKVLFMSGYTSQVIAQHGILEPGVNFIQKPFSVLDLTQKVRTVLDQ